MTKAEITYRELFCMNVCGVQSGVPDCRHKNNGQPCEELGRTAMKSMACAHPLHPDQIESEGAIL